MPLQQYLILFCFKQNNLFNIIHSIPIPIPIIYLNHLFKFLQIKPHRQIQIKLTQNILISLVNNLKLANMMPIELLPEGSPDQGPSITSSRYKLNTHRSDLQQSSFVQFKQQIEANFKSSVANQIYSFPLELERCTSVISSERQSLAEVEEYDLNSQNQKYEDLEKQYKSKNVENERARMQIEHEKELKKRHIRNQSAILKKRYQNLIKICDKSKSISKSKGKAKQQKNKKRRPVPSFGFRIENSEKTQKIQHKGKQKFTNERLRAKSNRLKTEPDESFKSTFRKPAGELKFGVVRFTES